jgi:hypothetical protein
MKSMSNNTQPGSSMVGWLDGVQMSEHDRKMAKAYLRKTESILNLIWLAGARIRTALAHSRVDRAPVGSGSSGHAPRVAHRA